MKSPILNNPYLEQVHPFTFSAAHKLCTYPTVMIILTVAAVIQLFTGGWGLFGWVLVFYGFLISAVSAIKITKVIKSGEIDDECRRILDEGR